MARYGEEHKEATRQRIVEAAGSRLKQDGIDGSGVSILMKDTGLTNGAFYAHFASKEALVTVTIADQLRQQLEEYSPGRRPRGRRAVRAPVPVDRTPRRSRSRLPFRGRCSTRSGASANHQARLHRRDSGLVDQFASLLTRRGTPLGASDGARRLRAARRHAATVPSHRRPPARRCGARTGHHQRAGLLAAALDRLTHGAAGKTARLPDGLGHTGGRGVSCPQRDLADVLDRGAAHEQGHAAGPGGSRPPARLSSIHPGIAASSAPAPRQSTAGPRAVAAVVGDHAGCELVTLKYDGLPGPP